jgi:Saccharopine dehydrogenase NADP binding domain
MIRMERRVYATAKGGSSGPSTHRVVVYGAYGHTGRFVTAELRRRGLVPVLSGRDGGKLAELGAEYPDLEVRPAAIDAPESLEAAFSGAAAVVNCAGPFLDTAPPVATAAVRCGVHYFDVAAEQAAVQAVHRRCAADAVAADIAVVPAIAFYGGLADLLATAAMADWADADEIEIAVALDRWWPTTGTRRTGERNTAQRLVVTGGALMPIAEPRPTRTWSFPDPFGVQEVIGNPFSEIITMVSHLQVPEIHSFINVAPLEDLHDPATPPPEAVDETGRSAQRFVVDVAVRKGPGERRLSVGGRDIYAVTAPIVVEAVLRTLDGRSSRAGVAAPGEIFDAADFLDALSPDPLAVLRSPALRT